MPNPKDPEKLAAYKEKLRAIALARGFGKWMKGCSPSPESVAKMREKQIAIGRDPDERKRRSERAKANGNGKWMQGRTMPTEVKEKIVAEGRGKTYAEIYGDRAEEESAKRRDSNRARWKDVPRKAQREKHNADYRYSDWRKAVFERDDFICRVCGKRGGALEAHHVKSWAKHLELRFAVDNGLTVHEGKCHHAADKQTRE